MPVGPRGEKRPTSSVSSMVKAMRVATGIEAEEYVDGKPRERAASSDDEEDPDGDKPDEFELAALEMDKPKRKTKPKKGKNKRVPKT